ncbi:MAG: BrnT family toxin [Gemmatimonadetes bacterium]|nr:BrnT family toxin [Gemmatimonadota bacterium]
MSDSFEWNPAKALANEAKHGISFEEAMTVFADSLATWDPDVGSYSGEERFIAVGRSYRQRLVLVVFTLRDGRIRIISARRPTPREARAYES